MAEIIPFKSRAQLAQEKKEKIQDEWQEWLEFEDQFLKEEMVEDNFDRNKEDEIQSDRKAMTEQDIIEDAKQYLTKKEIQAIMEFNIWLDKGPNN